jgi:putative oxidoreductase
MRSAWTLSSLRRVEDAALLVLRLGIGAFLIYGVWDNIVAPARMQEFVEFLQKYAFPAPSLMAPLSVWVQFAIGIAFILGLFTRWAAILCAINFAIAIAMVDRFGGIRGAFPALSLLLIGLYLATRGAGRYSLDEWLDRNDAATADSVARR